MVGHLGVVPNAAGLAMQDVLDHCQQAEKEQDSEQEQLARSVLQFAAVHGRTRRSGQHHRLKIWPIRVVRWLSNASLRMGLRDADTMGICS
jgi:hypothetical protein